SAVETMAAGVVPVHAAYAWNQALMDLGATLCRARRPLCLLCPLLGECGGPDATRVRTKPPSDRFKGSRRFYRGRILDELRALRDGETVPLATLAARTDSRGE